MTVIIEWKDLRDDMIRQCATAPPGNNYDTLCGLALHDLEEDLGEVEVIHQNNPGKVSCDKCKMIINHVVRNYANKK